MPENTRLFLLLLSAVGFFGVLGALFGAVTALSQAGEGRAAGTGLGWGVARQFSRLGDEPMTERSQALLAGAVDGFVFGAVAGLCVGLWATSGDSDGWPRLRTCMAGGLALALGAMLFGLAARGLASAEMTTFVGLFAGGMAGAVAGFLFAGADGLMFGVLGGSTLGAAVSFRRR